MQTLRTPARNKGFTMTELAIVLAVAGIFLGGVWVAGSVVTQNMRVGDTVGQMITIVRNVRTLYASQSRFTGAAGSDITTAMVNAEVFPPQMVENGTPRTAWKTSVQLLVGAGQDRFRLQYNGDLPIDVCRGIVGRAVGKGRDPGLVEVVAGGSTYGTTALLNNLTATSVANCTSATFTFKLKG